MQPLTDIFQLDVLEYDPELDEEKKSNVWQIYWHKDEDFYVILIDEKEFEGTKSSESYKLTFPRKYLKERHERSNISESGKRLSTIISNQLGRKFYCAQKDCLLKQHSNFLKRMLSSIFFEEDAFYEERRECEAFK